MIDQPTEAPLNKLELTGRANSHVSAVSCSRHCAHPSAAAAFVAMRQAALDEDIDLEIVSAFRDYAGQVEIWNRKFRGERTLYDANGAVLDPFALTDEQRIQAILCWSALPGASRHHWGTEFDVIDRAAVPPGYVTRLLPEEFAANGVFAALARWLDQHAAKFGFYRPYDRYRGGFHPEPWHLSYWPLSSRLLPLLTVEVLREALEQQPVLGMEHLVPALATIHASYISQVAPAPV